MEDDVETSFFEAKMAPFLYMSFQQQEVWNTSALNVLLSFS